LSTSFREPLDFLSAVLKLREPLNFCCPFQDLEKKSNFTKNLRNALLWLSHLDLNDFLGKFEKSVPLSIFKCPLREEATPLQSKFSPVFSVRLSTDDADFLLVGLFSSALGRGCQTLDGLRVEGLHQPPGNNGVKWCLHYGEFALS